MRPKRPRSRPSLLRLRWRWADETADPHDGGSEELRTVLSLEVCEEIDAEGSALARREDSE